MSGFVPNTGTSSNDTSSITIKNDGWFPDIDSEHFRNTMRVGNNIVNEQVCFALQQTLLHVNSELKTYRSESSGDFAQGSAQYGCQTEVLILYHAAVYNYAKALLTNQYRDYDSTQTGNKNAVEMEDKIDVYKRLSLDAICSLTKKPRLTVDLL